MRQSLSAIALFLFIFLINSYLHAGGPTQVLNGKAIIWEESPVLYHTDQGDLGSYNNTQANTIIEACFQTWQEVSTATITFQKASPLPVDVTASNYESYLYNFSDGLNPMIFDSDGSIIDDFYGAGSSENILGFAVSMDIEKNGYFTEGLAVFNGRFTSVYTEDVFKGIFIHEFGHFFGLDHSQINVKYQGDDDTDNDQYLPTMFPSAHFYINILNPDDKASATSLYPGSTVNTTYGKIEGTVKWGGGQPVLGANVVAVEIDNEDMNQFSSVSDYYKQNSGEYGMYITPGDYKLFIEPVDPRFIGGSSVGPYAEEEDDPSFANPVTKEYYNGNAESAIETDLDDFVIISVAAGQTVSNIDFIAESSFSSTTTTSRGGCPPEYVDCSDVNGGCCPASHTVCCPTGCCSSSFPICPEPGGDTCFAETTTTSSSTTTIGVYDLSGRVRGDCRSDVTISLSGADSDEVETDPNGEFTFNSLPGGKDYSLIPYKDSLEEFPYNYLYEFIPPYYKIEDLDDDLNIEFKCVENMSTCLFSMLYGENSEAVEIARDFRDNVLSKSPEGQEIIKLYYQWSPIILNAMEEDGEFRQEIKEIIDGVLSLLRI